MLTYQFGTSCHQFFQPVSKEIISRGEVHVPKPSSGYGCLHGHDQHGALRHRRHVGLHVGQALSWRPRRLSVSHQNDRLHESRTHGDRHLDDHEPPWPDDHPARQALTRRTLRPDNPNSENSRHPKAAAIERSCRLNFYF